MSPKLVLLIVTLFMTFQISHALYELEVYRMFAYEEDGVSYGSKISTFNLVAVHYSSLKNKIKKS